MNKEINVGWSESDSDESQKQGWFISDAGNFREIEKDDSSNIFNNDFDAVEFVIENAKNGNELAWKAIKSLLRWPSYKSPAGYPASGD